MARSKRYNGRCCASLSKQEHHKKASLIKKGLLKRTEITTTLEEAIKNAGLED
jgi:excinuclease UvrABC nuclease subunit